MVSLAAIQGRPTGTIQSGGECLDNGFGVTKNDAEALKWYRFRAAAGGMHMRSNKYWQYV